MAANVTAAGLEAGIAALGGGHRRGGSALWVEQHLAADAADCRGGQRGAAGRGDGRSRRRDGAQADGADAGPPPPGEGAAGRR